MKTPTFNHNNSETTLELERADGSMLSYAALREKGVLTGLDIAIQGPSDEQEERPILQFAHLSIEEMRALKGLLALLPELEDGTFA